MYIAGNKQGVEVFNNLNHNELGNPHPQYENKVYITNSSSGDITYNTLKLFDMDIQFNNDDVENWEVKSRGLLLTFYYLVANTPKRPYEQGIINISIPFDENGNIKADINELYGNGGAINFALGTKLIDQNTLKYNIKLFVRFNNEYSSLRILPICFDTVFPTNNFYDILHNTSVTDRQRLDSLFKDIKNNKFINNNQFIQEFKGYNRVTYSRKTKEFTYRSGNTILINKDIDTIILGASETQTISKILYEDGTEMDGKKIRLIAYNGKCNIESTSDIQEITTGALVLKNKNNTNIPQNGIIEFYCYKNLWIENSRSFN